MITAGVVLMIAVVYLAWLNPGTVEVHLTPARTIPAIQLGVVLVVAFLAGASLVLVGLLIQGTQRSVADWWRARGARRAARADRWHHRGEALLWEGESVRARGLLLRAWRHQPEHRQAALAAATSYLQDADAAAAERILRAALEQHRGDPDLLLALSDACARQGDRSGAIQALEQIRAQHPRAARVLLALRDHYAAVARWDDAVAIQSTYLRTLNHTPLITRERQRLLGFEYEAALALSAAESRVAALERLVDSHPAFVPALVSLGDALAGVGRSTEALALWERVLRNTPRTVFIERLLQHASQPRQRQRWCQQLRKARAATVRADCVRFWQARIQLLDGQPAEVLNEIDALDGPLRDTALYHQLRAETLCQLGHVDQALAEYAATTADGATLPYACGSCGHRRQAWTGSCPHCGNWDTYRSAAEIAAA